MTLTRRQRNGRHRRVVLAGIGVSVALHAVLFGALGFSAEAPPKGGGEPDRETGPAPFEVTAIEVVEIRESPEVMPEALASNLPVVNTPAPVEKPEPAESSRGAAAAAASRLASLSLDEILGSASLSSTSLSMRPTFAASTNVGGAFEAVAFGDGDAGREHGDEDDEGEGFWQRLGDAWGKVALGSGGGKICKPPVMNPPVVVR